MRFVTSDPRSAGLAGRIGDVVHYVTGGAATALFRYGNGDTEWIEALADGQAEVVTADPRSGGLDRRVGSRVLYVPVSGPSVLLYRYSSAAATNWCTWSLFSYQPLDSDLTAIAALSTTGLVERTGSGTAAIRALGVGASTSVPTRANADARYSRRGRAVAMLIAPPYL